MLVVRNADVPGMIGKVGTILGDAGVNVDDMDVGKTAEGEAALMAISTDDRRCPREVVDDAPGPGPASSTPAPSSSTSTATRTRFGLTHVSPVAPSAGLRSFTSDLRRTASRRRSGVSA